VIGKKMKAIILFLRNILSKLNFYWQNFIEEMFGMGNFSCPTYKEEAKNYKKTKDLNCKFY
jgi:hypothetical protein